MSLDRVAVSVCVLALVFPLQGLSAQGLGGGGKGGGLGAAPPSITITSPADGSTRHALNPKIRIEYDTGTCLDDGSGNCNPVPGTLVVKLNGVTITGSFTASEWSAENGTGNAGANNFLANQWNTVYAKICNGHLLCAETTITAYVTPNPQQQLFITPLHPSVSDLSKCETVPAAPGAVFACDALVISHGIPGYVSVGQTRSVGVVYSSRSAVAQVTVPFDVELVWDAAASTVQAWLAGYGSTYWDGRGWDGTSGTVTRRAVLSRPEITAVGGYIGRVTLGLTARVHTAAGTWDAYQVDTLPYYFERDGYTTPIARGWSLAGISRIYSAAGHAPGAGAPANTASVLLVGGSPGAVYHYRYLSTAGSTVTYGRPEGAFATLTRTAGTGTWVLLHMDGTREFYSWVTALGYARLDSVRVGAQTTHIAYVSATSGWPATITDAAGKQIAFSYSGSGLGSLQSICAPAGAGQRCTQFMYGTSGGYTVVTKITDPDGVETTFGYGGPHGALVRTFTPRARGTYTFTYQGAVLRPSGVVMPNSTDTLRYLAPQVAGYALTGGTSGNPAASAPADSAWGSVTRPLGQTAYFAADRFGAVTYAKDPAGVVTWTMRGLDGQPIWFWRNYQFLRYLSYNAMGALQWARWENGDTTFYSYGGACATGTGYPCRPTQVVRRRAPTAPDTLKWSFSGAAYDNGWGPDSTYRAAFGWTAYTYESSGLRRVTRVRDPLGHETQYTYETAWGNVDRVIADSAKVCSPTCVWDRDTTVFEYDAQGRTKWTQRGAAGRRNEYGYDAIGRVTSVRDSSVTGVIVTQTLYDDVARTVTVRDGNNRDIVFLFDARGRRIRRTDPSGAFDTFGYDANDRLTTWTTRRNQTITYSYDTFDRLRTKVVPGSGTWTYGYNTTHGTLDTLLTPDASIYRVRDYRGRMTEERSVVNGVTRTVKYGYDDGNNVISLTDPWNGVYTYGWVLGTRSRTVSNPFGETFTMRYNQDGLISRVLFPTSSDSLTYSDEHRVLSAGYNGEVTYQRDPVTHGINRITSPYGRGTMNQRFGYDGFERLASDSMSALGPAGEVFTYDAAGNRTGTPGTYTYASTNAVRGRPSLGADTTYSPGDSLVYDAAGNPTWWKNKHNDTYDVLTWDAENRLTRVRRYSSGGALQTDAQFAYDGFGRRVKKVVGSDTTLFVWDGWELLAETNASGGALRRYTMNPDAIDFPLAVRDGSSSYWLHRDGQGNVYRVDNSSGAAQSSYRYRAWGDRYTVGTEGYQSRLTYKGREEDRETGLVYMRHRYYSPRLERFVNEDPIGVNGGLNVFALAGGDPCNSTDPYGLTPKCGTDFHPSLTDEVLNQAKEKVRDAEAKSTDGTGAPYEWVGVVVQDVGGRFSLRDLPQSSGYGPHRSVQIDAELITDEDFRRAGGIIWHTHTRVYRDRGGNLIPPRTMEPTRGHDTFIPPQLEGIINVGFVLHHGGIYMVDFQNRAPNGEPTVTECKF